MLAVPGDGVGGAVGQRRRFEGERMPGLFEGVSAAVTVRITQQHMVQNEQQYGKGFVAVLSISCAALCSNSEAEPQRHEAF